MCVSTRVRLWISSDPKNGHAEEGAEPFYLARITSSARKHPLPLEAGGQDFALARKLGRSLRGSEMLSQVFKPAARSLRTDGRGEQKRQ